MYLNSEISKITNANEVFEALAKGFSRYKDILDQSNVSSGPALIDIFYEAKFRKEPVTESIVQNEIRQVKQTDLDCYRYGFFFKSGIYL